ncbi:MAG: Ig-like domain-containing protein [Treponema sp.]|nr:Ig-like domain-containing protein [Treponema sp.]
MKKHILAWLLLFVICSLFFLSCNDPFAEDTGIIIINLGGGTSRSALPWPPDEDILDKLIYDIGISGNGDTISIKGKRYGDGIKANVAAGRWNVSVEARYEGELYAAGSGSVNVIAGRENAVTINMMDAQDSLPDDDPPPVSVIVSPALAAVTIGQTQQFTASVSGTADQSVTWSVSGSTIELTDTNIDETGLLYVALDEIPGTILTVSATLAADPSKTGTATVTVFENVNAITPSLEGLSAELSYAEGSAATALQITVANNAAILEQGGMLSYQWYSSTVDPGFSLTGDLLDTTSGSFIPPTTAAGTSYYWAVVTNEIADNGDGGVKSATAPSNVVRVVVTLNAIKPVLSGPAAYTYTIGDTATALQITVANSAAILEQGGMLSYQWYSSASNPGPSPTTGTQVGTNTNSFTPPTGTYGAMYYWVIVSNDIEDNGDSGRKTITTTSDVVRVGVGGGDGSMLNPFIVYDSVSLKNVGSGGPGGPGSGAWQMDDNYKMEKDIDLTDIGNWEPLLLNAGAFDGNGKTISNLTISATDIETNFGLFGYIGPGSEVKDLTLSGLTVNAPRSLNVGGLAGYNEGGTIENCIVIGAVSGNEYVGGVVGNNDGGTVQDCKAQGNINGFDIPSNNSMSIGGVVGYNDNSGTVQGCSYTGGTVTGDSYYVGGIVGLNWNGTVEYCYATGNVTGGDDNVGGVVGWNTDISVTNAVRYCYATGDVIGGNNVGGVAGDNIGTVEYCYATGSVTATSPISPTVGGVVGNVSNGSIVRHCYSTGDVTGGAVSGGIAGRIFHSAIIEYCYATGNVNSTTEYSGGIAASQLGSNQGSVRFCVALNPSVRAASPATYLGRILGFNGGSIPLTNNYARSDMDLYENTTLVFPTETTASGRDGLDGFSGTGTGQYNNQTFWTGIDTGWDFSTIWEWDSAINLPVLRGMP